MTCYELRAAAVAKLVVEKKYVDYRTLPQHNWKPARNKATGEMQGSMCAKCGAYILVEVVGYELH